MEETKSFTAELKSEPKLTGKMFRVTNPDSPEGADIHHDKFMFGEPFDLDAGETKEMDETIAKAASYVWGFLSIAKVDTKKKQVQDYTKEA